MLKWLDKCHHISVIETKDLHCSIYVPEIPLPSDLIEPLHSPSEKRLEEKLNNTTKEVHEKDWQRTENWFWVLCLSDCSWEWTGTDSVYFFPAIIPPPRHFQTVEYQEKHDTLRMKKRKESKHHYQPHIGRKRFFMGFANCWFQDTCKSLYDPFTYLHETSLLKHYDLLWDIKSGHNGSAAEKRVLQRIRRKSQF